MFKLSKRFCTKQALSSTNLSPKLYFQLSPFMKYGLALARFQVYFITIATTSIFIYSFYTKWNKSYKAKVKLVVYGNIFLIITALAMYFNNRIGRMLINKLYYHPATKQIQIHNFNLLFRNRVIKHNIANLNKLEKKSKFITHEVNENNKKYYYSTKMYGDWYNRQQFYKLLQNSKNQ